jgi:hypothetical protein
MSTVVPTLLSFIVMILTQCTTELPVHSEVPPSCKRMIEMPNLTPRLMKIPMYIKPPVPENTNE